MSVLGSLTGVKYWCGEDEDEGVPGKHSYPQRVPGPKKVWEPLPYDILYVMELPSLG